MRKSHRRRPSQCWRLRHCRPSTSPWSSPLQRRLPKFPVVHPPPPLAPPTAVLLAVTLPMPARLVVAVPAPPVPGGPPTCPPDDSQPPRPPVAAAEPLRELAALFFDGQHRGGAPAGTPNSGIYCRHARQPRRSRIGTDKANRSSIRLPRWSGLLPPRRRQSYWVHQRFCVTTGTTGHTG